MDPEQRQALQQQARARSLPARAVERARIVLRAADGLQDKEIAAELGVQPEKAARWRNRFLDGGLAALPKDAPRPGRPRVITEAKVKSVVEKTTREKPGTRRTSVSGMPRTPMAGQGCETCHGAGKAHVDVGGDASQIKNPKKLTAREVGDLCTTCHNRGEHTFWAGSQHDRRGLRCTTCHSNHSPESTSGRLVAKTQLEVCGRCHRDKLAKLDRSGHMPVREGKMQCSTCHNMHGSQNVRLLRVGYSIGESCTSCHPEKRGPFLWEHPPVRENCATCHDPHGSANERLLVAKQPFLCQRCHTHSRHPATLLSRGRLMAHPVALERWVISSRQKWRGKSKFLLQAQGFL